MVKSLESAAEIKLSVLAVLVAVVDGQSLLCHLRSPNCAHAVASSMHVGVQRRDVVDQSQVDGRESWPVSAVTDPELRNRWLPRKTPVIQYMLQVLRSQEIWWT